MIAATPREILRQVRARLAAAGHDTDLADHMAANCRLDHPHDDDAWAQALSTDVDLLLAYWHPFSAVSQRAGGGHDAD